MSDELDLLRNLRAPAGSPEARARATDAALAAFDGKESLAVTQGSAVPGRLTERMRKLWGDMMQKKLIATPALAGLVALPIAGYLAFDLMQDGPAMAPVQDTAAPARQRRDVSAAPKPEAEERSASNLPAPTMPEPVQRAEAPAASVDAPAEPMLTETMPGEGVAARRALTRDAPLAKLRAAPATQETSSPPAANSQPVVGDFMAPAAENRDRAEDFKTNPVRSALEDPVSTFSIDTDTASYAFVRRSLKAGFLPQADTVRVEEMVNYFPYDWNGPATAETPFNSTVTVMPTPWNEHTKLMHVAIKGYDLVPAEKPRSNLVFLIDVSGSMDGPDRLPLAQASFRLLIDRLQPEDTISIVTYAGNSGVVLEPTKVSEREKVLQAIDNLVPGGSTAGEAGIKDAYRLAERSFVEGGVNRILLATDGDFNVGASNDEDLKRLVEEKRRSGVMLSVLGYGQGNHNDQLMQVLAQNGNGAAAYIDTLAEAEKVLVQEAGSTLFPIAKDVKIQVEFNPQAVSEYRLVGYETRALNREDFNNDRVDAGEIGSGHAVTAIYEITPKGSPAKVIDDLRYGEATANNPQGIANASEYAFVKIRYKLPDGDASKLITAPVTSANEVASFDAAGVDQRFSVAVAAFGQKLRGTDQTSGFGYDRIMEIATAARGADPLGYRAEFLALVRLASALDASKR